MCSIIGAVLYRQSGLPWELESLLRVTWGNSLRRGRDGRGFVARTTDIEGRVKIGLKRSVVRREHFPDIYPHIPPFTTSFDMVGNQRAEPTTEFVQDKQEFDQQPYSHSGWHVVHNGTIANDKELRTGDVPTSIDSAAIVEVLASVSPNTTAFASAIRKLKGSYAILAMHDSLPGVMFSACNYRPIWYVQTPSGFVFASERGAFPQGYVPQMLRPYSVATFGCTGTVERVALLEPVVDGEARKSLKTALVVCSGGLDSVVSAAAMQKRGYELHLIHFQYGSRAQTPELEAVRKVAKHLGADFDIVPLPIYRKQDSPLLDPDSKVAGGEAGAEFAHEWVPARNTVLLAMAVAFAEARGYETIVLGNNLEEAGAYPDNEPEFIARWNDLLPFAVGDGKRMRIEMPVGNMMKHEIVALGHELDAPMDMTWSCYRAGALHCGSCGPCYMRRKAFAINGLPEVINYQDEQDV